MRHNVSASEIFGFSYVPCRGCGSQFLRDDEAEVVVGWVGDGRFETSPSRKLFHRWCALVARAACVLMLEEEEGR